MQSGTQFAFNTDTDFVNQGGICITGIDFVTLTSGMTYTCPVNKYKIYLRGSLLIAALTIQFPVIPSSLMDRKVYHFISNVLITAITLKAATGDTIIDQMTGIGVAQKFGYQYDMTTKGWYRES